MPHALTPCLPGRRPDSAATDGAPGSAAAR